MAVRQYIGARYVPKFVGLWNNTTIYNALEVVDNGSGTSYIARKTVPAGTALTNTEFWFVYGATSGAILDLQNRMSAAEGDISDIEGDITNIEGKIANVPLGIPDRTYLFLCDSYEVSGDYLQYITGTLGAKHCYSRAVAGAGFFNGTVTFYQILSSIDPLTTEQMNEITHIVICASGLNDLQTNDIDLYTAMQTLNNYFKDNMPNLKEVLLTSIGWSNHDSIAATQQARVLNNCSLYGNYACFLNWKYVDCTRIMKTGYYFSPTTGEGFHPGPGGGLEIARAIYGAILSNNCQWQVRDLQASYTMGLPAAWSGATITAPANGKEILKVSVNGSGKISLTPNDFIIRIAGITCDADYYDIELTPDVNWRNVIPVGFRKEFQTYQGSNGNPWDWCVLFRYDASHTVIRVHTNVALTNATLLILTDDATLPI